MRAKKRPCTEKMIRVMTQSLLTLLNQIADDFIGTFQYTFVERPLDTTEHTYLDSWV